jgi:hypothetical protein
LQQQLGDLLAEAWSDSDLNYGQRVENYRSTLHCLSAYRSESQNPSEVVRRSLDALSISLDTVANELELYHQMMESLRSAREGNPGKVIQRGGAIVGIDLPSVDEPDSAGVMPLHARRWQQLELLTERLWPELRAQLALCFGAFERKNPTPSIKGDFPLPDASALLKEVARYRLATPSNLWEIDNLDGGGCFALLRELFSEPDATRFAAQQLTSDQYEGVVGVLFAREKLDIALERHYELTESDSPDSERKAGELWTRIEEEVFPDWAAALAHLEKAFLPLA